MLMSGSKLARLGVCECVCMSGWLEWEDIIDKEHSLHLVFGVKIKTDSGPGACKAEGPWWRAGVVGRAQDTRLLPGFCFLF